MGDEPRASQVDDDELPVLELNTLVARMAGLLLSEETVQTALELMCALARRTIAGTDGAGVTLIRQGRRYTAAFTDDIVRQADALQYDLDEGPCLSAYHDKRAYRVDSLKDERRWPRWSPSAAELGITSVLSVPLKVRNGATGAVKVYSSGGTTFDDDDEAVLSLFADQAAIVLANVEGHEEAQALSAHLQQALVTRDMIGQAKGIIMEREGVTPDEAFEMLKRLSQDRNIKLRELAQQLVSSVRG